MLLERNVQRLLVDVSSGWRLIGDEVGGIADYGGAAVMPASLAVMGAGYAASQERKWT